MRTGLPQRPFPRSTPQEHPSSPTSLFSFHQAIPETYRVNRSHTFPLQEPYVPSSHSFKQVHKFNLLRPSQGKQIANPPVISTCVSSSGKTLAVVTLRDFVVYTLYNLKTQNKPQCMGNIDDEGTVLSGIDGTQLKNTWRIGHQKQKWEFGCAAVSDSIIAITASGRGCVILFSLKEEVHSPVGKFMSKLQQPDNMIRNIWFNANGQELVVLSHVPAVNKENWR